MHFLSSQAWHVGEWINEGVQTRGFPGLLSGAVLATVLWWLWRMRNEILFQNKIISVNGIFDKVVALELAYDMAKQQE